MSARVVAVIPARMGSSRMPGKPLARLLGLPMIEHVYRRTRACGLVDEVIIATCDDVVAEAAAAFGARVRMTAATHERASDRVAEAIDGIAADTVVMVQGDEPLITPDMVGAAVAGLHEDPAIGCVNLAAPIGSEAEANDPNTIKVVFARNGDALYFSRNPVPAWGPAGGPPRFKQVCVIPFRRAALQEFAHLPSGPLEIAESIDMLRFLENGRPVRMVTTETLTRAVDTPQDLAAVVPLLAADPFTATYARA